MIPRGQSRHLLVVLVVASLAACPRAEPADGGPAGTCTEGEVVCDGVAARVCHDGRLGEREACEGRCVASLGGCVDCVPGEGPCVGVCTDAGLCVGETVEKSRRIEAPTSAVWAVLSAPGHLERCHPFCERHEMVRWPGDGAEDTITYYSGMVMHRRIHRWLPGVGYDLTIRKGDDGPGEVSWRVAPDGDGASRLTMRLTPYLGGTKAEHLPHLRRIIGGYMDALLQGYAYCVETGQRVRRDQFGAIEEFSGPSR